jgi:hypothetical protein
MASTLTTATNKSANTTRGAPPSRSRGTGSLTLDWKPRPGDWRAVIMNADASRGVTANLQLGARTSMLWWLGAALLALGVVAVAAAGVLHRRAQA